MNEREAVTGADELRDGVSPTGRIWQEVETGTVAEYTDGQLSGLLIFGTVDYARLKAIPLRRLNSQAPTGARHEWDHQPTHHEIEVLAVSRKVSHAVSALPAFVQLKEFVKLAGVAYFDRSRYATPDEFYRMIADSYRQLSALSGTPTTDIGRHAGVPKTTAARWVREARKRGYLPPAEKGKVG